MAVRGCQTRRRWSRGERATLMVALMEGVVLRRGAARKRVDAALTVRLGR